MGLPSGVDLSMVAAVLLPIGLVTLLLRAVPFSVRRTLGSSTLVQLLGVTMPVGVMTVLVVYTLAGLSDSPTGLWPGLVAIAATFGLHLCLKRPAVSILVGTIFYMVLVNVVVPALAGA